MKRKAEDDLDASGKKRVVSSNDIQSRFREGLFDQKVLDRYTIEYAASKP